MTPVERVGSVDAESVPTTIWGALERAAACSEDCGVTVVTGAGAREFRSWRRIRDSARRRAEALGRRGIEPGRRLLVSLPTSFGFLSTYFGALGAGAVPIPFPTSDYARASGIETGAPERDAARRLGATAMITENDGGQYRGGADGLLGPLEEVWPVGELRGPESDAFEATPRDPDELAAIQLTEGATGRPRGVGLSHANLLANVRAMGQHLQVEADDVGVSWIPLHNALGLVGVLLFGVVHRIELVFIEPDDFLRRPDIWLRAISRHGGTLSPAPNFAFHYAVRRCKESDLDGVDLSSWRVAMNGGEPVRGQHMDAFLRRFGQYGLREEALTPVYGLSEATLGVAFESPDAAFRMDAINRKSLETRGEAEPLPDSGAPSPAERMHLVSVGRPLEDLDLEIRDPDDGSTLGPRRLGEIAVRGPCVMAEYVDEALGGADAGGDRQTRTEGDWLLTGDLGYVADGELYVVGRACDRIRYSAERWIYPEEVELFVDAVDGVHAGRTVAFGLDAIPGGAAQSGQPGVERLIVAVELQSGTAPGDVEQQIRALLEEHLAVEPHALEFLPPRSVPRTKSGKVRRDLSRRLYLQGVLDRGRRNSPLGRIKTAVGRIRREAESFGAAVGRRLSGWFDGGD